MLFIINRYKDKLEIKGDKIIIETKTYRIVKRIEDIVELREDIVYGGLFQLLFGPRMDEEDTRFSASHKKISLRFYFKEDEFLEVGFSIGDSPIIERSLKSLKKILNLLKEKNKDIKIVRNSEVKYIGGFYE